jgi:hypothetical protein
LISGVPGKPGRPDCVESDKDFIKIRWSGPSNNGGSPIQGYDVERRDLVSGRWKKVNREPVRVRPRSDTPSHLNFLSQPFS